MFCNNCGQQLYDNSAFCPHCGAKVASQASAGGSESGGVVDSVVNKVSERLDSVYGASEHIDLKFSDFFSNVLKTHTHEEAETVFIAGTAKTTPDVRVAAKTWQKPWFYSRVLLVMFVPYLVLVLAWRLFGTDATNVLPGTILLGSFAMPITLLTFFYEANAEQNISFMEVIRDFVIGGVLSIFVTFIISLLIPNSGTMAPGPAMLTGFIEELAKALVVAIFIAQRKRPTSILNGLLIGCAVGAGFAAFESAGYAFQLLTSGSSFAKAYGNMNDTIILRAILTIGGHVVWAALEGAGLALAGKGKPFSWGTL